MLRDTATPFVALLAAFFVATSVVAGATAGAATADDVDRTERVAIGPLAAADAMQEGNETTKTTTQTTTTTTEATTQTTAETTTTTTETTEPETTTTTPPDDGPSEATVEYLDCETVRVEGEVAELELETTYYTPGVAEEIFFIEGLSGTTVVGSDADVDVAPDDSTNGNYAIDYVTLYDEAGEEQARIENPSPVECDERARPDEPTTSETTTSTTTTESTTSTDDPPTEETEQSGSDDQQASNDDSVGDTADDSMDDESDDQRTSEETTATTTTGSETTETVTESTTEATTVFETEITGGTESEGQPGMGVAAALAALAAAAGLARRR